MVFCSFTPCLSPVWQNPDDETLSPVTCGNVALPHKVCLLFLTSGVRVLTEQDTRSALRQPNFAWRWGERPRGTYATTWFLTRAAVKDPGLCTRSDAFMVVVTPSDLLRNYKHLSVISLLGCLTLERAEEGVHELLVCPLCSPVCILGSWPRTQYPVHFHTSVQEAIAVPGFCFCFYFENSNGYSWV